MGCLGASALLRLKNWRWTSISPLRRRYPRPGRAAAGSLPERNMLWQRAEAVVTGSHRVCACEHHWGHITGAASPGPAFGEFAQGDPAAVRLAPVVCALARSRLGW